MLTDIDTSTRVDVGYHNAYWTFNLLRRDNKNKFDLATMIEIRKTSVSDVIIYLQYVIIALDEKFVLVILPTYTVFIGVTSD
jgi:hypothetical protein